MWTHSRFKNSKWQIEAMIDPLRVYKGIAIITVISGILWGAPFFAALVVLPS